MAKPIIVHPAAADTATVAEAARALGIGRRVVYQLVEQGRLRAVREGRALRIERESLERFRRGGELT